MPMRPGARVGWSCGDLLVIPLLSAPYASPPSLCAGRVRQLLGAVQAVMVTGRASKPPARHLVVAAMVQAAECNERRRPSVRPWRV